jgi:hypothetical protein
LAIVIFVDGVLRSETGSPIYQGLALYRMFNEDVRVVLLCDDYAKTNRWLLEHKINKLDDLVDHSVPGVFDDHEFEQVKYVRSQGKVDLIVTANTDLAKKLLEIGLDTLLFLHPSYLRPEFRPDGRQGMKSWASIEDEIDKQLEMIREDPRV